MPKIVDHEAYRKEILTKCLELFSTKGFSNTTMREIAETAGVSTGTLYHYFPTKQSILEKMIVFVRERNRDSYLDKIKKSETLKEKIDYITSFLLENENYHKDIILITVDLIRHYDLNQTAEIFTEFSVDYQEMIRKEFGVSDVVSKSITIFLLGLVVHKIITPDHVSYEKQISSIYEFVMTYMGNSSS